MRYLSVVFFLICFSASSQEVSWREISINNLSSVYSFKVVLNEWLLLKQSIKSYAVVSDGSYYKSCDFDGLTIEHIEGLGGYPATLIDEYFPDTVKLDIPDSTNIQTLITKHPCFLDSDRSVSWFFYKRKGGYVVIMDQEVT